MLERCPTIAPSAVIVDRDSRQRREIDIDSDGLRESVAARGVISPIVITQDCRLVAGERRLTAALAAGLESIPYRFIEDLPEAERQVLELEENIKRSALPWRDEVAAVAKLHALYKSTDADWSRERTAAATGIPASRLSLLLRVAQDLDSPRIERATSVREAFNALSRQDERKIADAINDVIAAGAKLFEPGAKADASADTDTNAQDAEAQATATPSIASAPAPDSILPDSFLDWAPSYSGPPFSFIHCDFPYGGAVFDGAQSGVNRWSGAYENSTDLYVKLIACLGANLDRLMAYSAHIMFWFPLDQYTETADLLREHLPSVEFQPIPLFWHKTDNVGILSDARRRPRNIIEAAFIGSRGDRLLVKATSNTYGSHTDKSLHPSTKPEPMLRYFFQMFVDENTRLLDPTCGSGAALRAAESLNASHVLGLEVNDEFRAAAQAALRKARLLRKATA